MAKIMGIVNLHHSIHLDSITDRRSLASTNFLGRYCFIDFAISNFTNSGINEIGILIKEHSRSLFRHLGSGDSQWALNSKTGGITLMYNEKYANNDRYNHDVNNLIENGWFLKQSNAEYVVVAPIHMVNIIDYSRALDEHIKSNADVTVIYKKVDNAKEEFIGCDYLTIDENKRVTRFQENLGSENERNISLEIYIMKKNVLTDLLVKAKATSAFFSLRDVLAYNASSLHINSSEYLRYLRLVDSTRTYLDVSLELLNPEVSKEVFNPEWPIYTRTYDSAPVKYTKNAEIKGSFISNGSIIKGKVENSILGRGVVVEEGAVVKNCVLFSDAHVGKDCHLEYVIADKETEVTFNKNIKGTKEKPLVIKEGDLV